MSGDEWRRIPRCDALPDHLGHEATVEDDTPVEMRLQALDDEAMGLVEDLLGAWREVGVTVLLAAHSIERLESHLDGRVVLDRGLVAEVVGEGIASRDPTPLVAGPPLAVTR